MALIEGFGLQNYGALKNVTIGKLWNKQNTKPLTSLVAVIGKNGAGKSALSIAKDKNERLYVESEILRQRRKGQSTGYPFSFLNLKAGKGAAWKGESYEEDSRNKVKIELTDPRQLGIVALGTLAEHPRNQDH
jgi:hypothetical protein